ncbi:hypothetical protein L6452_06265 [Arctium lappa]|uniref:Uncharacterized protein n=1 Tax=Arctium lappa TaxID=4217 RepID=A0ACB9EI81_ARCLA|nr:hypothetical protein L6452_06265 [Arctium lappa]
MQITRHDFAQWRRLLKSLNRQCNPQHTPLDCGLTIVTSVYLLLQTHIRWFCLDDAFSSLRRILFMRLGEPFKNRSHILPTKRDEMGNTDTYNIYAPICLNPDHRNASGTGFINVFDPRWQSIPLSYLNDSAVQKAFHAQPTSWDVLNQHPHSPDRDCLAAMVPQQGGDHRKLTVDFCEEFRQAVGTNSEKFNNECGIICRKGCPFEYMDWRKVPKFVKATLRERILVR